LGGLAVVAAVNGHARTLGHAAAGVPSLALHLVTVAVWVGGLGALVVVAGPAWRMLDAPERSSALRALVPRFSRLAMGSVALVIVTGTINALIGLASVSDLWKVPYGRVVLAKVVLLAVALCFGARHLVTPRRLEGGDATGAQSFRRTSAVELAVLVGAVGLAAGLIALVPGRSLALQASGAVAQEHKSGAYTIQLFVDPGKPGTNDIHITYSNAQGLGAAEVVSARASFSTGTNPPRPLSLRLISAGHFVATADLRGDRYTVVVRAGPDGGNAGSTFHLTIHAKG
jgi:uncharacterized membrane protein